MENIKRLKGILGVYRMGRLVGKGVYGKVYLAKRKSFTEENKVKDEETYYAMKIVDKNLCSETTITNITREV